MKVRVRLGAGLSRLIGRSQLVLEVPSQATVEDLLVVLERTYPPLASGTKRALTVVSGSQVERSRTLAEGEEVSLLFATAGG